MSHTRHLLDARGTSTLTRQGDRYVMSGATGSHSLSVSHTDDARLADHWEGFLAEQPDQDPILRVKLTSAQQGHAWMSLREAWCGDSMSDSPQAHEARIKWTSYGVEGAAADLRIVAESMNTCAYDDIIVESANHGKNHVDIPEHFVEANIRRSRQCVARGVASIYRVVGTGL